MFISTNHRVITVGKMMVRTLVTFVGWPAAAWIRPARTEPAPGEEDAEEGGQAAQHEDQADDDGQVIGDPEPAVGDRAGDASGSPMGVAGWKRLPTSPSRAPAMPATTRRAGSASRSWLLSLLACGGLELVGAGLAGQ
jgi:hypothetical protein